MEIAITILVVLGLIALLVGWCWFCYHHPFLGLLLTFLDW